MKPAQFAAMLFAALLVFYPLSIGASHPLHPLWPSVANAAGDGRILRTGALAQPLSANRYRR